MPRHNKGKKTVNWKTNLAVVWISQFISLSAFYFCLPFLPLYLKEKQIVPVEDTAFWSGVLIAAAPVSMMIMSPVWGMLGDRYGRKMMMVRSTLAGAFVLYLMAVADNIETFIVLRLLQGAFTGTVPSAQSLVAAATPDKHQGFALGLMMAAINAAYTAGAFFGGLCAMHYGAASTFKIAGLMLLVGTFMVLTMVRENFIPPTKIAVNSRSARIRRRKAGIDQFKSGIPVLLAIAFVALVQTYDGPFLPLYVEELFHHTGESVIAHGDVSGEVFRLTGSINALASIIAVGGSISISYIMDRKVPRFVWALLGIAGASGLWFISMFESVAGLTTGRTIFLFFVSGLSSVLVVILSRMTPPEKRGSAMGWTVTARCIGWTVAPLIGGMMAEIGYVEAYWWLALASLLLAPIFWYLTGRYAEAFRNQEQGDEEEAMDDVVLPPQSLPTTPKQTTTSGRFFGE